MSAKHTPGPWVRGGPDGHLSLATVRTPDDTEIIAEVFYAPGFCPLERAEADFALIAAAPALADALRAIYDELYDRYDGAPDSGTRWMARFIGDAEAALRKAGLDP